MRKILLSLLLATTVATPALAQRPDREDRAAARQERHAERSQARQERSEARQEPAGVSQVPAEVRQAPAEVRQAPAEVRQNRVEMRQQRIEAGPQRMQRSDAPVREIVRQRVVRNGGPVMNVNERGRPTLEQQPDASDTVVNRRRDRRDPVQQRIQQRAEQDSTQQRMEQRVERNRLRAPVDARPDRPAPAPETASNRNRHPEWRTDWRRDRHYDWRNYRHHHRSIFRLGIYFDPFGWNYRRYGIGWRLWPSYYSSNYWLSDPYMYRLPYAPFPYKWVRYYDDALLVNTYTGEVVDVMYDFFW
jgi:Ni/Co efflux regulator RcnB